MLSQIPEFLSFPAREGSWIYHNRNRCIIYSFKSISAVDLAYIFMLKFLFALSIISFCSQKTHNSFENLFLFEHSNYSLVVKFNRHIFVKLLSLINSLLVCKFFTYLGILFWPSWKHCFPFDHWLPEISSIKPDHHLGERPRGNIV